MKKLENNMKLTKFYSEGELSSIRMSNEVEAVEEVKNLFFSEQLIEEGILIELRTKNRNAFSMVDELRLDFDRIYSLPELRKKALFSGKKLVDSAEVKHDFPMSTVLFIKNEQRYLNATFRNFQALVSRSRFFGAHKEPMLFARLKNNNFYLLNPESTLKKSENSIWSWIKNAISFKTSSK